MTRCVLVCLLVSVLGHDAEAGQRCKKLPEILLWTAAADVHEDGMWHRTTKSGKKSGWLSRGAYKRWYRLYGHRNNRSKATDVQLIACLDALIADEKSKTATTACTPKPAKSPTKKI